MISRTTHPNYDRPGGETQMNLSTAALVRRMNSAPDFGYDDEAVELTRRLGAEGRDWRWSGSYTSPRVEIYSP